MKVCGQEDWKEKDCEPEFYEDTQLDSFNRDTFSSAQELNFLILWIQVSIILELAQLF